MGYTVTRGHTLRDPLAPYALIQRAAIERLSGNPTAVAVYATILTYTNNETATAWPKQETVAEILGVSVDTVQRAVKELVRKGVLVAQPRLANGRKVGNEYVRVVIEPAYGNRAHAASAETAPTRPTETAPTRLPSRAREPLLEIEQTIEQRAAAPPPDEARTLVERVWERKKPKPAQPFVAIVKIARKLLDAGHSPTAIENAMIRVPTISVGWCEGVLNKRAGPNQNTATERAQNTMDRIDEFFAKERANEQ